MINNGDARISIKNVREYPFYLKPFFWNQKRKYGQVLIPGLLWGRVPGLFMAVATLFGVLDRKSSPIEPVIRSLITVRVSQINWCKFCVDINSALLAKRAGSEEKIIQLESWQESDLFSEKERAVLEYTESITYSDRQTTDNQILQLKKFFNEDEIIELTGIIAFQNLSSKFNSALNVPSQGFCKINQYGGNSRTDK